MGNDESHKFKQNRIIFCIQTWFVEYSRPVVFGEDGLGERGSLPATFYVLTRVILSMMIDNFRKFKGNQIIFCKLSWFVKMWRHVDFGEDRLRKRGSLPDTFFVLSRVFYMANDNSLKCKQNHIIFCIQPWNVCLLYTSRCV